MFLSWFFISIEPETTTYTSFGSKNRTELHGKSFKCIRYIISLCRFNEKRLKKDICLKVVRTWARFLSNHFLSTLSVARYLFLSSSVSIEYWINYRRSTWVDSYCSKMPSKPSTYSMIFYKIIVYCLILPFDLFLAEVILDQIWILQFCCLLQG